MPCSRLTLIALALLVAAQAWAEPPRFKVWDRKAGKFGFMDARGNVVIPPRFADAQPFSEGLAAVCRELTSVHVDEDGTERDVLMAVSWEYIDTAGKTVIPDQSSNKPFAEGLAMTGESLRGPFGYMDRTGKVVIPVQFKYAGDFHDGRASVTPISGGPVAIDRSGKVVIPAGFTYLRDFSEGLAVFHDGKKYGYVDRAGKIAIPARYAEADAFSEGLAYVRGDGDHAGGYIDRKGKLVIELAPKGQPFRNGLARVLDKDASYWIDKKGRRVIDNGKEWIGDFSEGLAARTQGGKIGYVDRTGKFVIPPRYGSGGEFKDGLAEVGDVGPDSVVINQRYIDRTGKEIAPRSASD